MVGGQETKAGRARADDGSEASNFPHGFTQFESVLLFDSVNFFLVHALKFCSVVFVVSEFFDILIISCLPGDSKQPLVAGQPGLFFGPVCTIGVINVVFEFVS